jgi:hypothetical protein
LKSYQTESDENGQFFKITKELNYGKSQGIGVLSEVNVLREQKSENGAKARVIEEQIRFKNYKINSSEAFKYFLGETAK